MKQPVWILTLLLFLGIILPRPLHAARAQEEEPPEKRIQILTGQIESGGSWVYRLVDLPAGEKLYVRMENTGGNLDPIILLLKGTIDLDLVQEEVNEELLKAIDEGRDPFITLPEIYDRHSLVWSDDYRSSSTSAFDYTIPEDGAYKLLVGGAPGSASFGGFLLRIGINAPEVLDGRGTEVGPEIAVLSPVDNPRDQRVKQVTGLLTEDDPEHSYTLRSLNPGDTVYVYVERTSGELAPRLTLRSFNGKPLRTGNVTGTKPNASLNLTLDETVHNYKLEVSGVQGEAAFPTGNYRLLIGINDHNVLDGQAQSTEESPLEEPLEVRVGVKLQQITDIDQQAEKFGAVAEVHMEWRDPALAFNPDDCHCDFLTYSGDSFSKFADENEILIPDFTLYNQQGNRWVQNRVVVLTPDGRARYVERFTSDFQAPLFDFVRFPFDEQELFIEVVSIAPEFFFKYDDPPEFSEVGGQLGEEEWFVVSSETEITTIEDRATYALIFYMRRYLNFYIYRIFLPIGLVILVSWLTFFLKDYGKRVDVSSANLLVFVAYNFTVSGDLPRLGYLTFMDAILIGTFVVSIFVVLFSVILRRLETTGREELAYRLDLPMIWVYPLLYILGALIAYWIFLA